MAYQGVQHHIDTAEGHGVPPELIGQARALDPLKRVGYELDKAVHADTPEHRDGCIAAALVWRGVLALGIAAADASIDEACGQLGIKPTAFTR